jgi:hypothetical protein
MKIFNQDMRHYKAQEAALTVKSICWAIIAVISISVIVGKMEYDKTSFVAEQYIKHQKLRK